jgi:hypothetical protein
VSRNSSKYVSLIYNCSVKIDSKILRKKAIPKIYIIDILTIELKLVLIARNQFLSKTWRVLYDLWLVNNEAIVVPACRP